MAYRASICASWLSWACWLAADAWPRKSQVNALQSQNRTLSEQTRAQLAEIENLKIHSRKVEDRLIRAEEDLARAETRRPHGQRHSARRA